jgi:hypothetical protein
MNMNNNQTSSHQQFLAALSAGVFPRMPMLPGLAKAANINNGLESSPRDSGNKSPASSTGGDSDIIPEVQPLDLSNKSSIPLAFPPQGFPVGIPGVLPPSGADIYRFQDELDSFAAEEEGRKSALTKQKLERSGNVQEAPDVI